MPNIYCLSLSNVKIFLFDIILTWISLLFGLLIKLKKMKNLNLRSGKLRWAFTIFIIIASPYFNLLLINALNSYIPFLLSFVKHYVQLLICNLSDKWKHFNTDSLVSHIKFLYLPHLATELREADSPSCYSLCQENDGHSDHPFILHPWSLLCSLPRARTPSQLPPCPLNPHPLHNTPTLTQLRPTWSGSEKKKDRGSKRGRGSSGELVLKSIEEVVFPCALKHFLSATNLSTPHGSCARVHLAVSLFFSPVVLAGRLGANHRWKVKGQQSSTTHVLIPDFYIRYTFYLRHNC